MASELKVVELVCEQMRSAGQITFRKMFGEFAIYCDGTVVALVCDNQLFVKPTPGGWALLGAPAQGAPYPGAKPHFLMDDEVEDAEFLSQLIAITARELPPPKPKTQATKKKVKARARARR